MTTIQHAHPVPSLSPARIAELATGPEPGTLRAESPPPQPPQPLPQQQQQQQQQQQHDRKLEDAPEFLRRSSISMMNQQPPSPQPSLLPPPPLSLPTLLQLELSSSRPPDGIIRRPPGADGETAFESAGAKIERLQNFFLLPPRVERVLVFGALACLDAWLHTFTVLPLRFGRAIGRLGQAGVLKLKTVKNTHWDKRGERQPSLDRDGRRRRRRPPTLRPADKADLLRGLLLAATTLLLMRLDASRIYHWIRGQAAIKFYVVFNVLEVGDRLLSALGQDVLECLFSAESLERRPDGTSRLLRPLGLFVLALGYCVLHSVSLFYQVITLNVAVNSYSNALVTLLLSNQFVEIKGSVFKKFERENLFQMTCADVVERFQLWLMLTIIAARNLIETGTFDFVGGLAALGADEPMLADTGSAVSNTTTTATATASSIIPKAFTMLPASLLSSLPPLRHLISPFLIVLGSETAVDWLKHAYINKFGNNRPAVYSRFLDVLSRDYYVHAFGADPGHRLTRRLGLPVLPLAALSLRVSIQTYSMFLTVYLPAPSPSGLRGPYPSPNLSAVATATPTPASGGSTAMTSLHSVQAALRAPAVMFPLISAALLALMFVALLLSKLALRMSLLAYSRGRYERMLRREQREKEREREKERDKEREKERHASISNHHHPYFNTVPRARTTSAAATTNGAIPTATDAYIVDGARRFGAFGVAEVTDDVRSWLYADDPEELRRVREKENRGRAVERGGGGDRDRLDGVMRYEMVAKRIW